jgi:hypothetical protein
MMALYRNGSRPSMTRLVFLFFLPNRSEGTNDYGCSDRGERWLYMGFIKKKGYNTMRYLMYSMLRCALNID